ncbi:MAG: alpha/beta hydrolase-fold protein [bacterium]|nr:alpha/beta hydrolase-fold protein [bacterium]
MKHLPILLTIIFIIASGKSYSQTPISIGNSYTIESEILEQDREIMVYLPDDYDGSEKTYPILYILDGQWHFTNGVAIQKSLRVPDRLPEMIVVGIKNQNPLRRTLFWDKREDFINFLKDEVISFVETKWRASGERILFGWESAGYFSSFAIVHESQLFDLAIASNGSYISEETLQKFESLDIEKTKNLFIANSNKDIYSVESSESLVNLLEEKAPKNLSWEYQKFNEEVHESLAYTALYHGLTHYYHDFHSLVFESVEDFHSKGGLKYLEEYYQKRGERYGIPTEVDNSVKNSLIWLAWKRDDFESFKFFMSEFSEVLETKRYASAYWQNRLGQFYLKYHDLDNAISYFNTGINLYPDDYYLPEIYNGLGRAYKEKDNKKLAKKHLKKAVDLASKNSDERLERYKKDLSALK